MTNTISNRVISPPLATQSANSYGNFAATWRCSRDATTVVRAYVTGGPSVYKHRIGERLPLLASQVRPSYDRLVSAYAFCPTTTLIELEPGRASRPSVIGRTSQRGVETETPELEAAYPESDRPLLRGDRARDPIRVPETKPAPRRPVDSRANIGARRKTVREPLTSIDNDRRPREFAASFARRRDGRRSRIPKVTLTMRLEHRSDLSERLHTQRDPIDECLRYLPRIIKLSGYQRRG